MSPLTESVNLVLANGYTRPDDPDAVAYIAAVEAADTANGQSGGLETATKMAINAFVKGCKADGIWPALKACCILAGARTRQGALVPLVNASGVAPTFAGTAGGWGYNRKTGLQGNGTDNYINSGRAGNADPQNNIHQAVYADSVTTGVYMGTGDAGTSGSSYFGHTGTSLNVRSQSSGTTSVSTTFTSGFVGIARSNSSEFSYRHTASINGSTSQASVAPNAGNHFVFARNGSPSLFTSSRLAFYSIGEALDLAKLDARVTTLINAIGAAIP